MWVETGERPMVSITLHEKFWPFQDGPFKLEMFGLGKAK